MDLMLFSTSIFTIAVTLTGGYYMIQYLWPHCNKELAISKAFKCKDYDTVITLTEGKEFEYRYSFNIYTHAAQSRMYKEMYQEALVWLEAALVTLSLKDIDRLYIERNIGDVYRVCGDLHKAEIHYRTAVSIKPKDELSNHKLAEILFETGNYDLCRKVLRPMLKANSSLIDSRKLYAECLAELGKYSKAIRHYGIVKRSGDDVLSLNYAKTVQELKIWDHAYPAFIELFKNKSVMKQDKVVVGLIKSCIAMKKYHEGLGIIEQAIKELENQGTLFQLKYMRAEILFLKGDQMLSLQEYNDLYTEKPTYKDLGTIVASDAGLLDHKYLSNYFTSNEAMFESLIAKIIAPGMSILRRTLDYFLCIKGDTAYIFYRSIKVMPVSMIKDIDIVLLQTGSEINLLEVYALRGLTHRYSVSGTNYKFILRSQEDFLSYVERAVFGIEYLDDGSPAGFVSGFRNLQEIIPMLEPIVTSILNQSTAADSLINDKCLNKAFER